MLKINLSEYKNSKIYFQLFDVILKDLQITKDSFLIENDITPSSYRLSRKIEQNIGKKIINKLANIYGYVLPTEQEIDEIEKKLNKIYMDIYYKVYDQYDEQMKYLDELLEKKYLIFPVIKLFKIFLRSNNQTGITNQIKENQEDYDFVSRYVKFLNDSTRYLYDLHSIVMAEDDVASYLSNEYDDALFYFILSSKSYLKRRYVECYHYAIKCKEILIAEGNYRRLMYLNRNLRQCYLHFNNYELCYELSKQEIIMCKSFGIKGKDLYYAREYLIISCLGLNKYDEIIEIVEEKEDINVSELCVYLVALYEIRKDEYNKFKDEYVNSIDSDDAELKSHVESVIDAMEDYLTNKSMKKLSLLSKKIILEAFVKVLEYRIKNNNN